VTKAAAGAVDWH